MTTLEREITKMRLRANITLLAQAIEMGREIGTRMLTQATYDEAAMVAMQEMIDQLDDEDEVTRLAGSPVVLRKCS